jgi:hypothetical protein
VRSAQTALRAGVKRGLQTGYDPSSVLAYFAIHGVNASCNTFAFTGVNTVPK